jgi:hypothetical protein
MAVLWNNKPSDRLIKIPITINPEASLRRWKMEVEALNDPVLPLERKRLQESDDYPEGDSEAGF